MVLGVKPVKLLVKLPTPVPSLVFEPVTTGFVVVPQQTPLAVTSALPSSVILPPDVAVVVVILEAGIAVVVSVGTSCFLHPTTNAKTANNNAAERILKTFFMVISINY
jgi:hypothetical protein